MPKPSDHILRLARELIRLSKTDWSEAEAEEFLDQMNPSIRRGLLLQQLTGPGNRLTVDRRSGANKIAAIKSIRAATGWGLKESKEFVELAGGEIPECYIYGRLITDANLPAELGFDRLTQLARDLAGTGYQLE